MFSLVFLSSYDNLNNHTSLSDVYPEVKTAKNYGVTYSIMDNEAIIDGYAGVDKKVFIPESIKDNGKNIVLLK